MCNVSPPNKLHSLQLDSARLLLSWRDPSSNANCICKNMTSTVTLNRIIQRYAIKVTENNTGSLTSYYTTDDRHLLIDNLQPHHQYTFRVAIDYATDTGPYSQPLTVLFNSTEGNIYKAKLAIIVIQLH